MTGFLFGELPPKIKNDQSPFGLRVFPQKKHDKKVTVKGAELLKLFENDRLFDALTHEDAVRVCLLLVAEVVFTPWYNLPNHLL